METFLKRTLPVDMSDGYRLDEGAARSVGTELHERYSSAEPFPHIVLDDFFPEDVVGSIVANFPRERLAGDKVFENPFGGLHKRQVYPYDCRRGVRDLFYFLNSVPMLQFIEGLTGIRGLIPDPYFNGGGFHEIFAGGKLGVHADFRINEQLHLSRRVNLLLYLNQDWREDFGGNLELWDRAMRQKEVEVAPIFNRCVVFNTDGDSFHGHPEPLKTPDGVSRRSLALYYYTASKAVYLEEPAHSTMYVARPGDSREFKKQMFRQRLRNYLKDWLPPVAHRMLTRTGARLRELARLRRQS